MIHSRSPTIFQYLLAFIRYWAQHVGLYGQVYGYLCESEQQEFDEWIGWIKSRLIHFFNVCEKECNLTLQMQNTIHCAPQTTQAYYFIAFQFEQQILMQHRNFTRCLIKFLDQFNLYPQRKDTMTVSYRFISVQDWQLRKQDTNIQL